MTSNMSESDPPSTAIRRVAMSRSVVQPTSSYGKYRAILRKDSWFSCAYCSITEAEAMAIGFQIDHYDPIMDDRNDYSNLFWACSPCNRTKGDFWALRSSVRELGYALIRIDQTHPNDHFELVGLRLEPKTKTGETSITLLRLNRKNLLTLREARRDLGEGEGLIMNGVRELFGLEIDRLTPCLLYTSAIAALWYGGKAGAANGGEPNMSLDVYKRQGPAM